MDSFIRGDIMFKVIRSVECSWWYYRRWPVITDQCLRSFFISDGVPTYFPGKFDM